MSNNLETECEHPQVKIRKIDVTSDQSLIGMGKCEHPKCKGKSPVLITSNYSLLNRFLVEDGKEILIDEKYPMGKEEYAEENVWLRYKKNKQLRNLFFNFY